MNTCEDGKVEERQSGRRWIALALGLGLTIAVGVFLDSSMGGVHLEFTMPLLNERGTVSAAIYHVAVIAAGVYIGYLGLRELVVEKRFSVEFLMAVAALGAAYLDFLFEAASVLLLYSLSEYFESYIQERARRTVEKLSGFMPFKARVTVDGSERNIDVKEVPLGAAVTVRPGERIPLDGTVLDGVSQVDQSLVTGESLPVSKKVGDHVYAGTLNTSSVLKIVVSKKAEDTLVSTIVRLVMESRRRKARIEKLVDKFAKFYVPAIILLSLFTAVAMPRLAGGPMETWIYRSLVVLVVSCPSAFVVSVPATIFTAITVAARKGVIIKGGVYVEKLAKVKTVVFDKTGTLTLGKPAVHEVKTAGNSGEEALLFAAALDQYSNHPTAQAIVRKAAEKNLDLSKLRVANVEEVPGKGMVGYVNGAHVAVGNMELMSEHNCNCDKIEEMYSEEKHTGVCVSIEKSGTATFCILDDVRQDAEKAVRELKQSSVKTAMLTGDKLEIARETANRLGIEDFHAELLPEEKLKIVDQMKKNHGLLAMVGDGVNDAPALAASDVGIAMGGIGVDVALESADVVLVRDELAQVPYLMRLSKKTMKVAQQNIGVSLIAKILLGGLGIFGFVPLWFTVASGDDGITLLLILNSLRLTRS